MSRDASSAWPRTDAARDRRLAGAISAWFAAHARPFPWRPRSGARDPYVSLVSEVMLQQTQASRVAERLPGFLARFPTLRALAEAEEEDVLGAWTGLGYYRRARTLHACAGEILDRFGGEVPEDPALLLTLPGIGRYSAGAIASIVFQRPEPIVDANVARVLLRIEGVPASPKDPATVRRLWDRAQSLVERAASPAQFNEGLMELGALVCTPRSPACADCPVSRSCRARRLGVQDSIPARESGARRRTIHHAAVVVRDGDGRYLMERRPNTGLWATHWQAVALEREDRPASEPELRRSLGLRGVRRVGTRVRVTSAARVEIAVYEAEKAIPGGRGVWMSLKDLAGKPVAGPHRLILGLDADR